MNLGEQGCLARALEVVAIHVRCIPATRIQNSITVIQLTHPSVFLYLIYIFLGTLPPRLLVFLAFLWLSEGTEAAMIDWILVGSQGQFLSEAARTRTYKKMG